MRSLGDSAYGNSWPLIFANERWSEVKVKYRARREEKARERYVVGHRMEIAAYSGLLCAALP